MRLDRVIGAALALALAGAAVLGSGCRPGSPRGGAPASLASPGDHRGTVEFGGSERSYLLHVPPSYTGAEPTPLVVVFHGGGGSGEGMAKTTGWSELADREGFLVAYPSDITGSGMVGRLLDDLGRGYRIDRRRIYAAGFSNGAIFLHRLATELQGRFAAFAPVSGTMEEGVRRVFYLERPAPVLIIHGTSDDAVPWNAGAGSTGGVGGSSTGGAWAGSDESPRRVRVELHQPIGEPSPREGAMVEVVLYAVVGGA